MKTLVRQSESFSTQVSVQKTDANLGHQAGAPALFSPTMPIPSQTSCDKRLYTRFMKSWKSLALLVCAVSLAVLSRAEEPNNLWDISLTNCTGTYRVTVAAHEDYTMLDITYTDESGRAVTIAHHKGERGFLYAWPISVLPNGLAAVWECGTGVCTTVFPLTPKPSEPVFDEWSESAPEFVWSDAGQVMLFYSGKQFRHRPSGLWQPRQAALYLWTGGRYKLAAKVPYEQRFSALAALHRSTAEQVASSPCHN